MRSVLWIFASLILGMPCIINGQSSNYIDPELEFKAVSYIRDQVSIPANPAADDITKLGNHSLNSYTGALSYQIPLYTLQGYSLSVPITATYDGSGMKVQDKGGLLGTSWSLSAGGAITHQVNRHPDRSDNYFNQPNNVGTTPSNLYDRQDYFYDIQRGTIETQADFYHYNFNGRSGKFYIRQDKQVIQKENTDLKIQPTFGVYDIVQGFIITDDSGLVYSFTAQEKYNVLNADVNNVGCQDVSLPNNMVQFDYTSAFYLTSISNPYSKETISFLYDDIQITDNNHDLASNPLAFEWKEQCTTSVSGCGCSNTGVTTGSVGAVADTRLVNKQILSRIELKVDGVLTQAVDLMSSAATTPCSSINAYKSHDKKLDQLIVRSYTSGSAVDLHQFDFGYDCSRNRLTLKTLDICDDTGSNCHGFYMSYTGTIPTDIYSGSIDHWGYFNNSSNSSLVPCGMLSGSYSGCSDREPNNNALNGRLTSITLPTGGTTDFEIEANQAAGFQGANDRTVGGLRLKSVKEYDIDGSLLGHREYSYELENPSSSAKESSGLLISEVDYVEDTGYTINEGAVIMWGGGDPSDPCNLYSMGRKRVYANAVNGIETIQGSIVGYSRITAQDYDLSGNPTDGKTVSNYINYTRANYPGSDLDMVRNGQLKSTEYFDSNDNLIKKETTTYSFEDANVPHEDQNTIFFQYRVRTSPQQDNAIHLNQETSSSTPVWEYNPAPGDFMSRCFDTKFLPNVSKARIIEHYTVPVSMLTEEWFYDANGTYLGTLSTTKEYSYDMANHRKPISESVTNSDGKVYSTEYSYADSYDDDPAIQTALLQNNTYLPPYKTEQSVDGVIVDGTKIYRSSTNGALLPTESYRYEWDNGSGSWEQQTEVTSFNSLHLPTTIDLIDWNLDFVLSYSPTGKMTSWQFGNYQKNWVYDPSTDHISSTTAIDGTMISYVFDGHQRLESMTDNCRNVTSSYDYHYAGQASSVGGSTYKNFVKTTIDYPLIAGSAMNLIESYAYSDGQARPVQQVRKNQSPDGSNDIVTHQVYDALGRVIEQLEPFPSGQSGGYAPIFGGLARTTRSFYADPLQRPLGATPPSWYETTSTYSTNDANDNVLGYSNGELYKTIVTDPEGNQSVSFTDKIGRTVLSRKSDSSDTPSERLDTYYFFDEKGQPLKTRPPNASDLTPNLCYFFDFDTKGNMIWRSQADSDAENYIYNDRDQLVGYQNPTLQAQGLWMVSMYDEYGRVTQKGYSSTAPSPNAPSISTLLEEYFYDGFDGSNTISGGQYIGRVRKQRIKQLEDNGTTDTWIETAFTYDACGRMTSSTGTNHLSGTETITQTFDAADNVLTQNRSHTGPDGLYTCNKTFTYDHVGRAIDTYMQINGGTNEHISRNTYTVKDELSRLELGIFGADVLARMDYLYNDQGWLQQINDPLPGSQDDMPCTGVSSRTFPVPSDLFYLKLNYETPINNLNTDSYKNGNITSMEWQSPMKQIKGYSFSYDFNNRLKKAIYGQIDGVAWLQTDFYSTEYTYDKRGNIMTLLRNGRSEEMIGSCFADEQIDNLSYTYANNSNKMIKVDDSSPCPSQITLPETINSNQTFAADKIVVDNTTIDCRSEVHIHAATEMVITDALELFGDCQNGGVTTIHDDCPTTGNPEGFAQNSENGQYTYDNAGNMITDPNKNISIEYNHLNLPFKVSTISGVPKELLIEYDAMGTKLSQSYFVDGVLESRRDYINGIEYRNSIFESMQHEHGRAVKGGSGGFLYEYNLKDHLGNTRVRIADINGDHMIDPNESPGNPAEVLSIESHYPFGLKHRHASQTFTELSTATNSRYGYNGKELVSEMDLDWMPYGFRNYDPAIGRFTGVDPISDQFPHLSTYNYASLDPIKNIDLHGLQGVFAADGSLVKYNVQKGQGPSQIAKDINENYGCYMDCEVTFMDVVNDNPRAFQNVFDGDGEVNDINNIDFKSGNIEPDQILDVSAGKEGGIKGPEIKENDQKISDTQKTIDSLEGVSSDLQRKIDLSISTGEYSGAGADPKIGSSSSATIKNTVREFNKRGVDQKVDALKQKVDSLNKVNDQLKKDNG